MYDRYSFMPTPIVSIIGMTRILMMSFVSEFIQHCSLRYVSTQSKSLTQINNRDLNHFAHLCTMHTLLQNVHKYIHILMYI